MKPRAKPPSDEASRRTVFHGRDGLAAYTVDPEFFPQSRVVYYNDNFVVINDLYPKASVHLLILPRDAKKNVVAPQNAFDDPVFLQDCRRELVTARAVAAGELRRRFGKYSRSDRSLLEAMEAEEPPEELPAGRDWDAEVISGIHANPSMNHLHIHVLSRDMHSECMRKTNHYLSFTTDFLVDLDQFPLAKDDHRRNYTHFPKEMDCWRCGRGFGNRMAKLKEHLDKEFERWIKD